MQGSFLCFLRTGRCGAKMTGQTNRGCHRSHYRKLQAKGRCPNSWGPKCFIQSKTLKTSASVLLQKSIFFFWFRSLNERGKKEEEGSGLFKIMKDNRYPMSDGFALDVRPVRIVHFTVGWPVAVEWGRSTGQREVRTRKRTCPVFYSLRVPFPQSITPHGQLCFWMDTLNLLAIHQGKTATLSFSIPH